MKDVQQAVPVAGEAVHRLAGEHSDDATKHLEIRSPLNRAIYKAVREFRLTNMCYSDDPSNAYPLVDLMSNPAPSDIGTGEMQMVDLVDEIETAVINARLTEPARKADRLGEGDIGEANHDCLAKRRPGEPMFILLGRDPDAWRIVQVWADRRLAAGGDPHHVALGLKTANAMRDYAADPANHPASAPDASAYPPIDPTHTREAEGEWPENVEELLSNYDRTIRARPGGGPEDLILSLVLTFNRMKSELAALNGRGVA
jgi:hypothetical protein